jgi:rhomboid-like protein
MASMNRYFMLSAGAPRAFSMLGATMSHQFIYWHLATNAAVLFLVGMPLHEEIGRWNFLGIYFISGIFGNVGTLWWHVLRRNFIHASSGASGALYGLLGAFFTVQPERDLSIPGMSEPLTYNSWYGVGAMVILLGVETRRKHVDHLVHMGGFAAGVLMGWVLRTLNTLTTRSTETVENEEDESSEMLVSIDPKRT